MFQISVKNCNPPWEKLPALCQQHSSKNLDPLKSPIFKNMVGGLIPSVNTAVFTNTYL